MPPKRATRASRGTPQKAPPGGETQPAEETKSAAAVEAETAVNGNEDTVTVKTEEIGAGDGATEMETGGGDENKAEEKTGDDVAIKKEANENGAGDKKEEGNDEADQENQRSKEDDDELSKLPEEERQNVELENYRIEIRGLPSAYKLVHLKDLLNDKLRLEAHNIRIPRKGSYFVFVCFSTEAKRKRALGIINNYFWKGRRLSALSLRPRPDPKKRKLEEEEDENAKKAKKDVPIEEAIQERFTPLASLSYEEQLKKKQDNLKRMLTGLGNHMKSSNLYLTTWLKEQKEKYDGLPCEMEEIRPSPVIDGYRNKCELTVGVNPENQEWTVGCRLSAHHSGTVGVVGPVDLLKHMPQAVKDAAKLFQTFVRESKRPPFNPEKQTGVWRQLVVRTSNEGGIMLIVICHTQDMKEEDLTELKEKIKGFFEEGEGKNALITSLYFQASGKKEPGSTSLYEHLLGEKYIWESVKGVKFRISPESFFRANTAAAEVLYDAILELSPHSGEDAALVDVCCGTGTIGLTLAKSFGEVLGIDISAVSIEDATTSATDNDITNATFTAGRAEDELDTILEKITKPNPLVVIDPPKGGIHTNALAHIRKSKLNNLVYVSSDPQTVSRNIAYLGRAPTESLKGNPFVPVKAIPVDAFPHTPQCEIAILFERMEKMPELPPGLAEEQSKRASMGKGGSGGNRRWRRGWRRGGRGYTGFSDGGMRQRDRDQRVGGMQNRRREGPRGRSSSGRFGREGGVRRGPDSRYGMEGAGYGRQRSGPQSAPFFRERGPEVNRFEPVGQQDQRMAFALEALRRFDEEMERRRTVEQLVVRSNRPPLMQQPKGGRGGNRRRMSREDFTRDDLPRDNSFFQSPRWPRGGGRPRDRM